MKLLKNMLNKMLKNKRGVLFFVVVIVLAILLILLLIFKRKF